MEIYAACATDNTRLVPQARQVLEHFYHAGVKQGLCTNKPVSVTRQILDALDIKGYFASIVGGDSTAMKKPHPLPLLTCLEALKTRPEDALMIGDSGADVGAARAANVPVILVPDGYTGVPAVSLGADFVVGRLADIPSCFPPHPPLRQSA
jgi:phosphoglycolate phosphatase